MSRVFVLDKHKQPLMPCQPARARKLLRDGKAAVYRHTPFTIILKDHEGGHKQAMQYKIDPGSKTTGIALVADFKRGPTVVWGANLEHRASVVVKHLKDRSGYRRRRRTANLRYRPWRPRAGEVLGANKRAGKITYRRMVPKGWLAPSMRSRLDNTMVWAERVWRYTGYEHNALEDVKFDTQLMANPAISGVEYQQGTLAGYEVREYLLEKWGRKCAYCGAANVPLQIEHIVPKSRGGSNRIDNLAIACGPCNQRKGNNTADEFGHPALQAKAQRGLSMRDMAAVNATRIVLRERLEASGLIVELGTGALTKYNRTLAGYPKDHWIDAACVGAIGSKIIIPRSIVPKLIIAKARGSRQACKPDKFGFPRAKPKARAKTRDGIRARDFVRVIKRDGTTFTGFVTSWRAKGGFSITDRRGQRHSASPSACTVLQRSIGHIVVKHDTALDKSAGM
jgi:5-methylcytosine-specific restriction endonuclease McrA